MNNQEYLERVYSGLLGKCIGVRLGAPVEPTIWTYERIRETYGEITDYVKDYKNFAADDDVNGPLFFIRTLIDHDGPLSPQAVSRAWLNYTREGIGFYWWGGFGRSTEHTAYTNLKNGISAPESGSIARNGSTIAEQIGGQIFIDSWGWVFPGDANKAAEAAGMAASVGHDGNGIYGGRFIAACVSLAFIMDDIEQIIEEALDTIPADCEYTRVVTSVRDFYHKDPDDWRKAMEMLTQDFGYDRYPGVCHIIPNAGVCALSMYYGRGDFARTIEIATMCGWDTDCNAGNVGAILGVMVGPKGLPHHYRQPINDWHAAASISGALNNIDLPTAARELAILGLKQAGALVPEHWKNGTFSDDIVLDFSLPGSTCGIRSSSHYHAPPLHLNNDDSQVGATFLLDRLERGQEVSFFTKPYYTREDFDDQRYRPSFTPLAYPGQILKISGIIEHHDGGRMAVAPFVRDARSKETFHDGFTYPDFDQEFTVEWTIPETPFAIAEAGLLLMYPDPAKFLGHIKITGLSITGNRNFQFKMRDERHEFEGLSRLALAGGYWDLEDNSLHVVTSNDFQCYGGPYYTKDSNVAAELVPEHGFSHLLAFRARGAEYGYFFGFHGKNQVAFLRRDHGNQEISTASFPWVHGTSYQFKVEVRTNSAGCEMTGFIDGVKVLQARDSNPHPYGMAGLGMIAPGRARFLELSSQEIPSE